MSTIFGTSQDEAADADKVDKAIQAMQSGDDATTEILLLEVIHRAPRTYVHQFEDGVHLKIKFWDPGEFIHYVTWMKDNGALRSVVWIGSAYPRAFFHLGFLKVKARRYAEAIGFLDQGSALEPTNPRFAFEKAISLMELRRRDEALALFETINLVGPHVSPLHLARAWRGRGSVLLEMGHLDRAEGAFQESLKFEPKNKIALNELLYISHLRRGMIREPSEVITSSRITTTECGVCGNQFKNGTLAKVKGKSSFICETCQTADSNSKKWWKIWK